MRSVESIRSDTVVLRESRRARNSVRRDAFVGELQCECGRQACDATLPACADAHRRADEFIVVPLHVDGDRALVIDDRFAVVGVTRNVELRMTHGRTYGT
ncbi:MAG: hypothetical protein QOK36_3267 [Gaiellales bacterium]|nr:hypothetical protein [Gaiellales bacterium]